MTAMSFRARMILAVTLMTLVTLGGAFAVISVTVNRSQERHFDHALLEEAATEAADLSRRGIDALPPSGRPGPTPNHVGPLPLYAALYDGGGKLLAATPSFSGRAPPLAHLPAARQRCFNFYTGATHLRGVLTGIPGRSDRTLLLALPRQDLDGDVIFLRRAIELVFAVAVAWTVLVTTWIVRRLTRAQRRVAQVIRQVAAGDLTARVGNAASGGDEIQLAHDLDDMVDRLSELLNAQRVFIANAAHELRSPLTALYGELCLALRRSRDAGEYRQTITEALESTRALKLLAEDLLAVARLGAGAPLEREPVEVQAALDEAVGIVLSDGPRPETAQVVVQVSGPPAAALARPRDVVRLFRNLIENAFRHSPPGGTVRVEVAESDGQVSVTISDEGLGISDTDRDRVFAPFHRGSEVPTITGGEVGLGLTIARGLARAHEGDVMLHDGPGRGACFRVTLPAAPPSATADRRRRAPEATG